MKSLNKKSKTSLARKRELRRSTVITLTPDQFESIVESILDHDENRKKLASRKSESMLCIASTIGLFLAAGTNSFGIEIPDKYLAGLGTILMAPVVVQRRK